MQVLAIERKSAARRNAVFARDDLAIALGKKHYSAFCPEYTARMREVLKQRTRLSNMLEGKRN